MSRKGTIWQSGSVAALLTVAASFPVQAHHSAAMFDMTKRVIFHGTVEKWLWANPHAWLYLRVEKKGGVQEIWGFEAGGPNMLIRQGWNAADIKVGEKVIVTAAPERAGKHLAQLQEVQLSDGRVLKGGGPPPDATGKAHPPQPYE